VRSLTGVLLLTACGHGAAPQPEVAPAGPASELAPDDEPPPSYGSAEIRSALTYERGVEAALLRQLEELDAADDSIVTPPRRGEVVADLAVRRRAIAILERCDANGRMCPPRLDAPAWEHAVDAENDPTLDVPLRFDLEGWRKVASELHWRACGCRTSQCIESIEVTIARLETRPMADIQQDDAALTSVVRARECLMRLAGKRALAKIGSDPN
jgi:hypothetical protein